MGKYLGMTHRKKKQYILTHLKEFTSLKKSAFYLARKYYLALFGIFFLFLSSFNYSRHILKFTPIRGHKK